MPPQPKREAAAIRLATDAVTLIAGTNQLVVRPRAPYWEGACEFLDRLSQELMRTKSRHSDVISFAYWCRKTNIQRFKQEYGDKRCRLGLGLVFHITPSNVPTNFAYSYAFGLLSGNANLVKLPSKNFPQTDLICDLMNRLFERSEFTEIRSATQIVRYQANDDITTRYSLLSRARVIWGGDETVAHVRSIPAAFRCVDIVFPDRYSLCVIDARFLAKLDSNEISQLAERFYNDTYLMDQNACSSPHLVIWLGEATQTTQAKFWKAVEAVAETKYEMPFVHAIDKYVLLCRDAIQLNTIRSVQHYGGYLCVVSLGALPETLETLRGKFGYFYEYEIENISRIASVVTSKIQTITYFGVDKDALCSFVIDNGLMGIDRIVPIGKALAMNIFWDGVDMVKTLSRVIDAT